MPRQAAAGGKKPTATRHAAAVTAHRASGNGQGGGGQYQPGGEFRMGHTGRSSSPGGGFKFSRGCAAQPMHGLSYIASGWHLRCWSIARGLGEIDTPRTAQDVCASFKPPPGFIAKSATAGAGRKNFFFEKKKQKTFIYWLGASWSFGADNQKFF